MYGRETELYVIFCIVGVVVWILCVMYAISYDKAHNNETTSAVPHCCECYCGGGVSEWKSY